VPPSDVREVYLVLDDFGGRIGQTWRETGVEDANLETVLSYRQILVTAEPVRRRRLWAEGQPVWR
jgi:hypothetical protein